MYKQIKFFKISDEIALPDLKLGDKIETLLHSNIIKHLNDNEDLGYRYTENEDIWIEEELDIVKYIYFTNYTGCDFLDFDPYSFPYPATEPITNHLSEKFEHLKNINSIEELNKRETGDYLIVIFSDFIPRNIFLKRIIKK